MILNFFVQYHSVPGQSIFLSIYKNNSETTGSIFNLNYYDENYWHGIIDTEQFEIKNKLFYSCHLMNADDGKSPGNLFFYPYIKIIVKPQAVYLI